MSAFPKGDARQVQVGPWEHRATRCVCMNRTSSAAHPRKMGRGYLRALVALLVPWLGACGSSSRDNGGSSGADAAANDAIPSEDAGCPPSAPSQGSPCSPVGAQCSYGSICCGGGYTCSPNGTWQPVLAGCACPMPEPDGGVECGANRCLPDWTCCGPPECAICIPPTGGICAPSCDGGAADAASVGEAATPAADAGSCSGRFFAALDKHCVGDSDCELANHNDCCGTVVVAITKGTSAQFQTGEQAFQACVPGCGLGGCFHPDTAEDGQTILAADATPAIVARCDVGRCTSHVQ
jgi:hypothetical protein